MTHVLKIKKEKIEELRKRLEKEEGVRFIETTNQYEVFRLKYKNGTVVAYSSGKIVINRDSAFRSISNLVEKLGEVQGEYDLIIGLDEAGKGEWLGPLVVGGVALSPKEEKELGAKGVMDSKELSKNNLIDLHDLIKEKIDPSHFNVVNITPSSFNKKIKKLWGEGKNLNDLLAWAHTKCVEEILRNLSIKELKIKVIIDEFDRMKTAERMKRLTNLRSITLIQEAGAEVHIPVAAASILARGKRETWIDKYSQKQEINLRELTPEAAYKRKDKEKFSKISYLQTYLSDAKKAKGGNR